MSVVSGSLEQSLDGMLELHPFPAAASRLMAACSDESATVRELTEIIKFDAGLSMRLLQMANSPLYGFSGEIRSIDHATVVLGMRALRDLAVSTAVGDVFDSGSGATAEVRKNLWQHSLACGTVARLLAEKADDVVPDEAFLGGVIHDIGKLFMLDHDADGYVKLLTENDLHTIVAAETETYGMPHTVVGQRCGQNWGLPDEVIDVIEFHHAPEEADFGGALVDVVYAANHLTVHWFEETDDNGNHADVLEQAQLDVDPDSLEQIKETSLETVQAMSDFCG